MSPLDLNKILSGLPFQTSNELLVGLDTADDAAVFQISEEEALIQTVDFFPPIVDDPYLFGQIAAANALSDIYAMGGQPMTALNLVSFPCALGLDVLEQIIAGGRDKVEEAGAIIVGGHSVDDREPKYGLAVLGRAKISELTPNNTAKPGDKLVLTKPLGIGVLSTALKGGFIAEDEVMEAIDAARTLNRGAAEAARKADVKCATDITGFGLLGHLSEVLEASCVGARIEVNAVPFWKKALELAQMGMVPEGLNNNREFFNEKVNYMIDSTQAIVDLLFDPQTSGGLLIAVTPDKLDRLLNLLHEASTPAAAVIGETTDGEPGKIVVSC